jgi:hypothetical protein
MTNHTHADHDAHGVTTVSSSRGPECHAASYFCAKCVQSSRRNAINGDILRFWESQGVARSTCPRNASCPEYRRNGACALGWHGRDLVNSENSGAWLPFAGAGMARRADRCEFSHVRPAHGGAYCACNLVPESGARNASRGDVAPTLTPAARALLAAWPMWWRENVARKASLARLAS